MLFWCLKPTNIQVSNIKILLYYLSVVIWFGNFCITYPNLGNCVGDVLVIQDLSLYFFDILFKFDN